MSGSPEVAAFVAAVRRTVEPVEFMTDADLLASSLPSPVIRLLIALRSSLREFDVAEAAGDDDR